MLCRPECSSCTPPCADASSTPPTGSPPAPCSLTDEALDEPAQLLVEEAAKAQLHADEFVAIRHGATLRTAGGTMSNQPARLPVQRAA